MVANYEWRLGSIPRHGTNDTMSFKQHTKKEHKMVEVCLRIATVGNDGGNYGFKVGDLVNRNVFIAVRKELMRQGKDLPSYDKSVCVVDGVPLSDNGIKHYP